MAVKVTQNAGMLTLAIYLILTSISTLTPISLPPIVYGVLGLIAGVLILLGR
jgi:hypothetical protein